MWDYYMLWDCVFDRKLRVSNRKQNSENHFIHHYCYCSMLLQIRAVYAVINEAMTHHIHCRADSIPRRHCAHLAFSPAHDQTIQFGNDTLQNGFECVFDWSNRWIIQYINEWLTDDSCCVYFYFYFYNRNAKSLATTIVVTVCAYARLREHRSSQKRNDCMVWPLCRSWSPMHAYTCRKT